MEANHSKEKIKEVSFIRAICALLIIIYHFSCYTHSSISAFHYNANSQWGSPVVTVFFALSGAMLYLNNRESISLKSFYYKRWKAIYPPFYLVFAFLFLENVWAYGDLFYKDDPWTLIFTVLGIDGYVLIPNYYIIGEWFLGAIIILYLLFPSIVYMYKKSRVLTSAIVLILYVVCIFTNFSMMYKFRQIPVCLLAFYFGIVAIDYKEIILESKISLIISCIAATVLIFVEIPWSEPLYMCELPATLLGFSLFIIFYNIGKIIMKISKLSSIFTELGNLSYYIFLVQHVIIVKMTNYQNPYSTIGGLIVLAIIIALSVIFAKVVQILIDYLYHTKLFKKLDTLFLS